MWILIPILVIGTGVWLLMLRMPGTSHSGAAAPLTQREVVLLDSLRRELSGTRPGRRRLQGGTERVRRFDSGRAAPDFIDGIGWSDEGSLWQQGYPGIMITDTALFRNPNYHRPSDTPDTLDYGRLARVVTCLEAVVQALAAAR